MYLNLLLAFCSFSVVLATGDQWTNLAPGHWMKQISVKGDYLWAVHDVNYVYKWNGTQWTFITDKISEVAACADGSAWARHTSYSYPYRLSSSGNSFDQINSLSSVAQINAFYKDLAIAVTTEGQVYLWHTNGWSQIGHDAKWAAVGEGDERWMIGKNGSIYRWENHKWQAKPGPEAETIDVQSAHRVVITDKDYKIYTWQDSYWEPVDGLAKSATISETQIYAILPALTRTIKIKTCQDSFTFKADMAFDTCTVQPKVIDDISAEKCCKKCKKAPRGGGCYHHENECTICNGVVRQEKSLPGSQMFLRP